MSSNRDLNALVVSQKWIHICHQRPILSFLKTIPYLFQVVKYWAKDYFPVNPLPLPVAMWISSHKWSVSGNISVTSSKLLKIKAGVSFVFPSPFWNTAIMSSASAAILGFGLAWEWEPRQSMLKQMDKIAWVFADVGVIRPPSDFSSLDPIYRKKK